MSERRERMLCLFVLFSSFVSFTFFLFHLALFVLPLLSITKEPKEIRENKGTNPLHYLHFQVIESFPRVTWCDLFNSINAMAVKGNGREPNEARLIEANNTHHLQSSTWDGSWLCFVSFPLLALCLINSRIHFLFVLFLCN